MVSQNVGYVHHVAGMIIRAESEGEDSERYYDLATQNGISSTQLDAALTKLRSLPSQSGEALEQFIRTRYIKDGIRNGYVDFLDHKTLTLYDLQMLALDHHGH